MSLLNVPFIAAQLVIGFMASYLVLLGLAASVGSIARRRRPEETNRVPAHRFAILVPAHDEELMISGLLGSLADLDYPKDLYDVYVVADNCTDSTAAVVRARQVACYERTDRERKSKGHALHWLIELLLAKGNAHHDAYVIFDADSVVDSQFLRVMDRELDIPGLLQGYYGVSNASESWLTAVSTLGFSLQQYVKPLGRLTLGLPTRLLGNGMCLPADVVRVHKWGSFSISEDLHFFLDLLLLGIRTRFVPEAVTRAVMPVDRTGARSQRVRWEKGKMLSFTRYFPRLIAKAVRERTWAYVDPAIDLMTPPFTTLMMLLLAIGVLGRFPPFETAFSVGAWLALVVGMIAYVSLGAVLTGLPVGLVVRSFLVAPYFAAWKLWVLLLALVQINDRTWIRTPR